MEESTQIKIELRNIVDLKAASSCDFNKELECFEIITGLKFNVSNMKPADLTMLLELMATGAPMNVTFTCDQSMMNLERNEDGKLQGTLK